MLEVKIKKRLADFTLEISFVQEHDCVGILGASGAGKSMTLKCIAGLETPDEGRIVLNERVLFDSEKKINLPPQTRKVGYMFQNYALFPNMTVAENIGAGISKKEGKAARVATQMKRFLLEELKDRYPKELSGGQQQRVALARIMAHEPELLLLDEPFSAMDGYLKEKLQYEMIQYLKEYPGEAILVSHNRDDIYRFCPKVVAIADGMLLQSGSLQEVFLEPVDYAVARLTGCNNISKAEKISDYEVYAAAWDVCLKTSVPVKEGINYVGIRAHDIVVATDDVENCFAAELLDVIESPFEYKYHIKRAGSRAKEAIWWKVYKDLIPKDVGRIFPQKICLPKEKLLLLK